MGLKKDSYFSGKDELKITVRNACSEDAAAFLELGRSILREEVFSMTTLDELDFTIEQEQEWIESKVKNENHLVLVAEVEGKIVGQLDFSNGHKKRIAHTGEFGMGVHKDFRGRGIGYALLQTLLDWAKGHKLIEKINLSVHQTNSRAITLYEGFGFRKEGVRLKDLRYSENRYVDTVLMGIEVS